MRLMMVVVVVGVGALQLSRRLGEWHVAYE